MSVDSRFKIDGVSMPKPSSWGCNPNIMSRDAGRLAGNGKMVIPYLSTVWTTEWNYNYLEEDDFDIIWDAYVESTIENKNFYHTLETLDNKGRRKVYKVYTEDKPYAPIAFYKHRNGREIRCYTNLKFTFVGVGGEE